MEFFIKKNATLPLLKLQVVKDGRSDYNNFMKLIEVASIYFSMVDTENGIPKFTSRPAGIVEKTFDDPNAETEYYIYYQFTSNDTKDEGRYEGQFMIRSSEGVLILPIREKLFINIQDSFIADDLNYTSCYVSDFPCCVDFPTNPICPPCPSFEPSPTPTITPSLTPDLSIGLTLFSVITSGSIVVTYNLVATMPVFTEITLDFSHVLGTTGDPIVITTGVTLNQGSTSTILVITLDEDSTTLTNNAYFSGISINPPQYSSFFTASETTIFQITPTPTVTPTVTPTQPPEQIITDAVITNNVEYLSVGVDLYLSYIDPILPTPTPTSSITPTVTPTPSITPSQTVTPTPTNTETPTPTPTPTIPVVCDTFTFTGNNVTTTINSALKTTGGGWNSSAYSVETYTNPVYVTFNISNTNIGVMGGFSVNPTLSESTYENATFGLYCENGSSLKIYENGTNVYTVFEGGNITPSDLFKVEYNGSVVNYYYNGSIVYTSLQTITQPLHIFFPLLTENEGVINVCVIEYPSPTPTNTVTQTPTNTPTPTESETPTPTPTTTITPTPTITPNCVRQIVIPTLWNGATSVNSNTIQLTQTSETLQIQVNDIITDNIGATSFVGVVSSDGTYTYVYTGAGGGVSFDCQFPLTFSGAC